jgi:hypothetical protein
MCAETGNIPNTPQFIRPIIWDILEKSSHHMSIVHDSRHWKLWNSDFGTFLCQSQKVFFYKIYLLINIYLIHTFINGFDTLLLKTSVLWFFIISEHFCPFKTQPFIADKPRISIDISEFKHSYGGFMKIMCRIDAVPHPTQLEMRVGGKIFLSKAKLI